MIRLCEAGLHDNVDVKKTMLRRKNSLKMLQWTKAYIGVDNRAVE